MSRSLKPEFRPGGADRQYILDKAVEYILDQATSYKLQATSYKLQAPSATKRTQLKSINNLERRNYENIKTRMAGQS